MRSKFDFSTIKGASEKFGQDFHVKLSELERFEENVMAYEFPLSQAKYHSELANYRRKSQDPFYIELPSGQSMKMSRKAIADVMSKSKFPISIKSFDETGYLPDIFQPEEVVGTSVLQTASKNTHRDRQKLIEYDGVARAIMNHSYPDEAIKLNRLAETMTDMLEINGGPAKADMQFDVNTGNVRLEMLVDTGTVESAKVNDQVGFGFTVLNNFYGNRKFGLYLSTLNLACLNGMLNTNSSHCLEVVHSSVGNFATKIGDWIGQHVNYYDLPTDSQAIIVGMRNGLWVDAEYDGRFYELLSKTILDVVQAEKQTRLVQMNEATTRVFADIEDQLEKLEKQHKLSRKTTQGIENVWWNDDTIASNETNDYFLSMAVSRYANDPEHSFEMREELQTLANGILVRG